MQKSIFACILVVVFGILLAFPAGAESLGESAYFNITIPCDYMTITGVSYLRTSGYVVLEITFTTDDPLSDAALNALETMTLYLMPDGYATVFPGSLRYHFVESTDGMTEIRPGTAYIARSEYQGVASLPDTLYLRPYYKQPGAWGDVIVLPLSQAVIITIENEAELPQPLMPDVPGNG